MRILRMLKNVAALFHGLKEMVIVYFPGPIGIQLRYRYYSKRMKFLGENVRIDVGVQIQNPQFISIDSYAWIDKFVILLAGQNPDDKRERQVRQNPNYKGVRGELSIGKRCHIAPFCIISGMGGLQIGDNASIAAGSKVYSLTHHYRSSTDPTRDDIAFSPLVEQEKQALIEGAVVIGEQAGVAANCFVLPGVTVREKSFIALNSVVSKDIGPNKIARGNPAQEVGDRFL